MKIAGQKIFSGLKSHDILERKPDLKICSNHRHEEGPRWRFVYISGPPARRLPQGGYAASV